MRNLLIKSSTYDATHHQPLSIMNTLFCLACIAFITSVVVGCSKESKDEAAKGPKPTLITVATLKNQAIETIETTLGTLEGLIDPTISAEVAARVINVHVNVGDTVKKGQLIASLDPTDFSLLRNEAQAEVARVQALLENQIKTVGRDQTLVNKNFISQNALDGDIANQKVLNQQLVAARARVASINNNSGKTKIYSPINGIVEVKLVDTGDFVNVGSPIVQIISKQKLRAQLPFPESIGALLKPGLKVRLSTPTSPNVVETVLFDLKPLITEGNRTIMAIADVVNETGWQPGASVKAEVVISSIGNAVMVPEQSVILRPAGRVVYVIKSSIAHQVVVETGDRQHGLIEIKSGLQAGDVVAVDGAGFLTDLATITLGEAAKVTTPQKAAR